MNFWKYVLLFILATVVPKASGDNAERRPNVVLIITDDQDVTLNGMYPMSKVQNMIGIAGATFANAFTTSPLCCPSRASLLSGRYAHNHRSINNSISGGCYGSYWRSHVEPKTMAPILQAAGYSTFYGGKYLNQYSGSKVPPGWEEFYGLHGNSRYYNYTLRENDKNVNYSDVYLTDLLHVKVLNFLKSRTKTSNPFFAMVATPAPHAPFIPADRHRNAFDGVRALRTPNFNLISKDKHWLVSKAEIIPNTTLTLMDRYFQQRWETLLAVDELVSGVIQSLEDMGELDNTYVIYTSDNGYHIGQFAQPFDKRQPYETDIRVPLLIRGPSIKSGVRVSAPTSLIDIFPTMLEWLGLPSDPQIDGQSIQAFLANAPTYDTNQDRFYHRSLLVQHIGEGNIETYNPECPWLRSDRLSQCTLDAACHCQDAWNNTYSCLRHFGYRVNRLYCEFEDNEEFVEAYDVTDDPYQMRNIVREMLPIERALYSLALSNLTKCAGASSCSDVIL